MEDEDDKIQKQKDSGYPVRKSKAKKMVDRCMNQAA